MITKCCHIYCKGCVDSLFGQPLRDATSLSDEEAQRGCRVCPLCRAVLERGEIFRVSAIFTPPQDKRPSIDDDVDDASDSEDVATDRKGKGKAKPPQDKGRKRAVSTCSIGHLLILYSLRKTLPNSLERSRSSTRRATPGLSTLMTTRTRLTSSMKRTLRTLSHPPPR